MRTVQDVKANIDQLYHQERRRYKDASYGSFEKSRRYAMLSGLTQITDQMEKLVLEQHRMLRFVKCKSCLRSCDTYFREEYQLHETQIELICKTLGERNDPDAERAAACLNKIKKDMLKPYRP